MADAVAVMMECLDGTYRYAEIPRPACGELFCDECGDCYHCYSGDPCKDDSLHSWIIYRDDERWYEPKDGANDT